MWLYKRIVTSMIKIERQISIILIVALMLTVLLQGLLFFYSAHIPLNRVARLEGQTLSSNIVPWRQTAYIVLSATMQEPYANGLYVMINGQRIVPLCNKEVEIMVHAGDVLEIDGSNYEGTAIVTVKKADSIIEQPKMGQQLTVTGRIAQLGMVKFKNRY